MSAAVTWTFAERIEGLRTRVKWTTDMLDDAAQVRGTPQEQKDRETRANAEATKRREEIATLLDDARKVAKDPDLTKHMTSVQAINIEGFSNSLKARKR